MVYQEKKRIQKNQKDFYDCLLLVLVLMKILLQIHGRKIFDKKLIPLFLYTRDIPLAYDLIHPLQIYNKNF